MNFKSPYLTQHANSVRRIRRIAAAFRDGNRLARECAVHVHCAGGCGTVARVRADRVKEGAIFVCNGKATRDLCRAKLPRAVRGLVRQEHHQAAGNLTGLTWVKAGPFVVMGCVLADAAESACLLMMKVFRGRIDKQP